MFRSLFRTSANENLGNRSLSQRNRRTTIGYVLFAISAFTSVGGVLSNYQQSHITALELLSPIPAGQRIPLSNTRRVELSTAAKGISNRFASAQDLSHLVAKRGLLANDLIEVNDLTNSDTPSSTATEMAVPLNPTKAPIDEISPGNYVELIATFGSGSTATSRVIAKAVKVIKVSKTSTDIGQLGTSTSYLLISPTNPIEPVAIAQAETAGTITAIKVEGPNTPSFQGIFSVDAQSAQNLPPLSNNYVPKKNPRY